MTGPVSTTSSTVTSVEVNLTADGELTKSKPWGDPVKATHVQWRAAAYARGVAVSVTAYADDHQNRTWVDPRFFVADGLNSDEPPTWVPVPPVWFWDAVKGMQR